MQKELETSLKKLEALEMGKQLESLLSQTELAKVKLEAGVNVMTKELFQLKKQNSDAESKIKRLEKDSKNMQNESEKAKRASESQINKLKEEIDILKQRLVNEQKEHRKATTVVESLNKDLNVKESDILKTKQEVISLKSKVGSLIGK